jgi:hypothetical protein
MLQQQMGKGTKSNSSSSSKGLASNSKLQLTNSSSSCGSLHQSWHMISHTTTSTTITTNSNLCPKMTAAHEEHLTSQHTELL